MDVESKRKMSFWPGFGLIFGGVLGVIFFMFTMDPIYIGIATGLGLVVGSIISLGFYNNN
jgi:lipid-A-disaccharide synthase-like uncharacterized protein